MGSMGDHNSKDPYSRNMVSVRLRMGSLDTAGRNVPGEQGLRIKATVKGQCHLLMFLRKTTDREYRSNWAVDRCRLRPARARSVKAGLDDDSAGTDRCTGVGNTGWGRMTNGWMILGIFGMCQWSCGTVRGGRFQSFTLGIL